MNEREEAVTATEEQLREKAHELYEEGKTPEEVADSLGQMRENGVMSTPKPESQSPDENENDSDGETGKGEADKTGGNADEGDEELTPAPQEEELTELKARLATLEKQANDNKAWGTKANQEAAALKKANAELKKKILETNEPEILKDLEGLEGAIDHVLEKRGLSAKTQTSDGTLDKDQPSDSSVSNSDAEYAKWHKEICDAHSEFPELSKKPEIAARIQAKIDELGSEAWNPKHTIDFVAEIKSEIAENKRRAEEKKKKELDAMKGLGGTGKRGAPPDSKPAVPDYEKMTDDEFRKMQDAKLEAG